VDQGTLLAALAIAAVVVVAFMMRGGKRDEDGVTSVSPESPVSEGASPRAETFGADDDRDDWDVPPEDEDWDDDEVVAVTSDGAAFLPDRHAVRLVPPHEDGEAWKAGQSASNRRGQQALDMSWHAGDFTGARVVRGGGEEPWRLEALGRDGEYTAFGFETQEGAEAAVRLFESRGVVRLGTDEDGNRVPPSAEQFAEARRIFEETEQALAMEPGPGEDRDDLR
jgi:hypothetical protein